MSSPQPLARADLSQVEILFTDVDGTLTVQGRMPSRVVDALERLHAAGLATVLVTGRPAGFAECWLRTLPVDAVIAENGGLTLAFTRQGRLVKTFARPEPRRSLERRQLWRELRRVLRSHPGLQLSTDSVYTEVDLALDYNEEVSLGSDLAERLVSELTARGVTAVRSSVHVNCWMGGFDKATAVEQLLLARYRTRLRPEDPRFVYVGDSLNDAPLFARFALSVGVANVLEVLSELPAPPRYVTRQPGGHGFVEVAKALLRSRG